MHRPDPHDLVNQNYDESVKEDLLIYLSGGRMVRGFAGYSTCRICGKPDNGAGELTDGIYLWPEGLSHYVAEHSVALPPEFVEHARGQLDRWENFDQSEDWWIASTERLAKNLRTT